MMFMMTMVEWLWWSNDDDGDDDNDNDDDDYDYDDDTLLQFPTGTIPSQLGSLTLNILIYSNNENFKR